LDRREAARERGRQLAAEDPEGWFDRLYREAAGDPAGIPWADLRPNPNLLSWPGLERLAPGTSACVVGCGLGDDAEELAARGLEVTAFDVSPEAIEWCRRRWPASRVDYLAADLFALPHEWVGMFDFVFEAYTVQPLPRDRHAEALAAVGSLVGAGGTLLVVCRGRSDGEAATRLPWPLSPGDLRAVGLPEVRFEDFLDELETSGPTRRFRVEYRRAN